MLREHSGSVLECLTRDPRFEPHRLHCVVSLSKNINPSLVLVQPRKTRPFITKRLLMGRKESNQTSKHANDDFLQLSFTICRFKIREPVCILCGAATWWRGRWRWEDNSWTINSVCHLGGVSVCSVKENTSPESCHTDHRVPCTSTAE